MILKNSAIPSLMFFLYASPLYAGAWVQENGKGLFIANTSYYSATKYFDVSGNKQSQSRYRKYELNPYAEYGVSDYLTVGANIFLSRSSQYDTVLGQNHTNYGIGDSEFFARSQIYKDGGFVISVEPMIKLPSPDSRSDEPRIGSKNIDLGMGLSGGYGFQAFGLNHFLNLDTAYRHRFGSANDQLRFTATAGVSVTEKIMFNGQVYSVIGLSDPASPAFTQSPGDDYDLTKLQLSAIYKIDDTLAFQLGAFTDVDGKNTGSGTGTLFSVNKVF